VSTAIWLLVLIVAPLALVYRRTDLNTATLILGLALLAYSWLGNGGIVLLTILWVPFAVLLALNIKEWRRPLVSRGLLGVYRRMLPSMSRTEQEALEAGNVWWEGELFSGIPNWR
jgi:acyl-CoA dehydrogenase